MHGSVPYMYLGMVWVWGGGGGGGGCKTFQKKLWLSPSSGYNGVHYPCVPATLGAFLHMLAFSLAV